MINKPYDEMVKYIIIGDSNVGKTSILNQFCQRNFNDREQNTIGLDYGERIININERNVLIQLWDTAGQERFRTLTPSYYRSAMGILLVYSVTDKSSFNSIEIWMKQIKQFAVENIPILILSNKADVKEKQVSEHQSRALSERHHVDLLFTSAKDNVNIETAMVRLYHRIDK
jgi:small GTP-binding protein